LPAEFEGAVSSVNSSVNQPTKSSANLSTSKPVNSWANLSTSSLIKAFFGGRTNEL
jgi:hypothetical protein